jgi:serine/threonine-protein kinase
MPDKGVTEPRYPTDFSSSLAVGEILCGNYEILGKAGEGGMGVVYRARDLRLTRVVALKFLPFDSDLSEREKERFLREARIASSLDHPNIGSIYGIEITPDGRSFIVMAFYEGSSLAQRIRQSPVPVSEALETAIQIARGLAEAHAHKIIHRDIKPSNVMVTGNGVVKIVDFGLAYAGEHGSTLSRTTAGTYGYMAPEQEMDQTVDERADIWALGIVLAEVLTGRNPFKRENVTATLLAVLNDPPSRMEAVAPELQHIIYKALSKDRTQRYQSCNEILKDLEAARSQFGPGTSADVSPSRRTVTSTDVRRSLEQASKSFVGLPARRSRAPLMVSIALAAVLAIGLGVWGVVRFVRPASKTGANAGPGERQVILAVLPFAPVNGNAHLTALGEGVVESVGAKLSAVTENHSLEIIPARNLTEKGVTSLSEARRQFGANVGLSVALEQAGDLLKVSYSLMNAENGSLAGGNSITIPATDVFAVEDDVADGTIQALRLKLRPEQATELKVHGTTSAAAYQFYLQARGYLVDHTSLDNVQNAILMNNEALKLDANFGAAKASLGEAYWRKYQLTKDKRLADKAKSECTGAVSLGTAGAAGHACLGLVYSGTGEYRDAAAEFQHAVELEPSSESAGIGLALALKREDKFEEAEAAYQRVIDTHPQSFFAYNAMGSFYYSRSEYEKAIKMFQKVTELAPENYVGYLNLGGTYNDLGRFLEAIGPLKKSIALHPSYGAYTNLGTSYLGLHKQQEAAAAYQEAVKLDPKQYVTWGNLAAAQYYGNARPQALTNYRKAIELATEELKVNPHDVDILSDLALYYSNLDDKKMALQYLELALQYGRNQKDTLACAAQVYNQIGETGLALEWMSKAIQAGYAASKFRDLVAFQNLVDNPQYQEIVGKAPAPH